MAHSSPSPKVTAGNRYAIETTITQLFLPAVSTIVRRDMVHVRVSAPDDLAEWLHELGGDVRRGPESTDGVAVWTLHTHTPTRSDGTYVQVRVHAVVTDPTEVQEELLHASHSAEVAA